MECGRGCTGIRMIIQGCILRDLAIIHVGFLKLNVTFVCASWDVREAMDQDGFDMNDALIMIAFGTLDISCFP